MQPHRVHQLLFRQLQLVQVDKYLFLSLHQILMVQQLQITQLQHLVEQGELPLVPLLQFLLMASLTEHHIHSLLPQQTELVQVVLQLLQTLLLHISLKQLLTLSLAHQVVM